MNAVCIFVTTVFALPDPNYGSLSQSWHDEGEKLGLRIWSRAPLGAEHSEFWIEGVLPAPIDRVWEVMEDVSVYAEFMDRLTQSYFVRRRGPEDTYVYGRIKPPIADARDYTVKVETEQSSTRYIRRFKLAPGVGPPVEKNVVRMKVCEGVWAFEKTLNNQTRVTYSVASDPGGYIPHFIARQAYLSVLPRLVWSIGQKSRNPNWRP
jgi:hypothetical protein